MRDDAAAAAFLAQARSDFAIFEVLLGLDRRGVPECHPLHYLQMATEKLAKAAFFRLGLVFDRFDHVAFTHVPFQSKRQDLARRLGYERFEDYVRFFREAERLFRGIDELNPAVGPRSPGGGPKESENAEYPWRADPSMIVWRVPAEHEFWVMRHLREKAEGAELLRFVRRLLKGFARVFV